MTGAVLTHEEEITLPDTFPTDFDISKGQNYDIQFQWRGVGNYCFYMSNPETGASQLVHKIKVLGTLDGVSLENPALPIAYRVTSLGAADGLWSGCADVASSGGIKDRLQYFSSISNSVSCSTDTPILVIRQPDLIGTEINTLDIRLVRVSILPDKRSSIDLWLTRDPTAITGGSFAAIGNGSYVEENLTMTAVDTGKMVRFSRIIGEPNVHETLNNPEPDVIDFYLIHGDYLVATGNGSSVSIETIFEWGEEI